MANYLYNGVELPDINEVWTDKATYPYACIAVVSLGNIPPCIYSLCVFSGEHVVDEGNLVVQTGGKMSAYNALVHTPELDAFLSESGLTIEFLQNMADLPSVNCWCCYREDEDESAGENYGFAEMVMWANHDVLNTDGSVYLAASDPVPIGGSVPAPSVPTPSIDPTAMLLGWLIGKRIAGQRGNEKKEPVAYLYNGVRLPDINKVWTDKETYPYVAIGGSSSGSYNLMAFSELPRHKSPEGFYREDGEKLHYCSWSRPVNFSNWIQPSVNPWENLTTGIGTLKWSNFDVYDQDGNIKLAASDPVPVYE